MELSSLPKKGTEACVYVAGNPPLPQFHVNRVGNGRQAHLGLMFAVGGA